MIKIGIQGDLGSGNHLAAERFAARQGWAAYEIVPLRTTEGVLRGLADKRVDVGTFAWESVKGGLVAETQAAIKSYAYAKCDEIKVEIDHALLIPHGQKIDPAAMVHVYSHPQALLEHKEYLHEVFPRVTLHDELDTAYAAARLARREYPPNSLAIALATCAALYDLALYQRDLPANKGYWTLFYLVTAAVELDEGASSTRY